MVKYCDLGLENAAGGQHFQGRVFHISHAAFSRPSISPYGPTLSRQITYIYFDVNDSKVPAQNV